MGRYIDDHEQDWDLVLASPAERARQTVVDALPLAEPVWDERLYLADPPTIIDVLQAHGGDAESVLVVGHNPGLQEMLFMLVPEDGETGDFDEAATKYPTAAYSIFELDIDDWGQIEKGCGQLVHFKRPRDLDPSLGPES